MADGLSARVRPYRILVGSRLRSQTAYRASFALDLVGSVGHGIIEFAAIYVIFSNVTGLGGLDIGGVVLMFALANISFSLADMIAGQLDNVSIHLRQGTLDGFLLRPLPVLAQLMTADVQLRRLGRTAVGVAMLIVAITLSDIDWGSREAGILVVTVVSGTAIFTALFVCAAAVQFWFVEGGVFTHAFTYGGSNAASYPASIFALPLRVAFAFVVPAAFVAYLPTLVLLDQPGPEMLPQWLGWFSPVAAAFIWVVAMVWWRAGLRHYTGAGS